MIGLSLGSVEPDCGPAGEVVVRGPYFEELRVGQVFDGAPAVTLTDGLAAAHQAIVGDRLPLSLSHPLATFVLSQGPVAPAALVWNVAIGQSSQVTQHVRANLFYRGLMLRRLPLLGDTLTTTTTIEALKQNKIRAGRPATGLAVLRITTVDQHDRAVLDFRRCAMIPLRRPDVPTTHSDDVGRAGEPLCDEDLLAVARNWSIPMSGRTPPAVGQSFRIDACDVVTSAPELARLTLNIAAIHHDATMAGGRRLVYGGHTIAIALAQASRALPDMLTVIGWHSCDHLAPVHEGDLLTSSVEVERVDPLPGNGNLLHLRSRVYQLNGQECRTAVLDWRFVAISM